MSLYRMNLKIRQEIRVNHGIHVPVNYSDLLIHGREAKNKLKPEEFNALTINIVNYGRVPYAEYVTHISKGLHNPHNGVIFGGATDFKAFGDGFRLRFYDKVDGKKANSICG